MRSATGRPSPLRALRFENLEDRIVFSGRGVADFCLDSSLLQQPDDVFEQVEVATPLAEVHDQFGVTYVRNTFGFTGTGQTVVVIDSGVAYDHEALGGGLGPNYRVVGGWDFTEENDADPYDDGPAGFHGTHVAGIVGSDAPGHLGVAPGVDLVALRVFNDQGVGYFDWVEQALGWVHQHQNDFAHPITTVTLSLGATWNSDQTPTWATLEDELAQLHRDGMFVAVAAGNGFQDYRTAGLNYPAASPYVVPVASVGSDGSLSWFSQRNPRVLAAPGEQITSTVPDYLYSFDGVTNDYAAATGTSMSAPYVAGASVLVREALQFAGYTQVTQDMIYDRLGETADWVFDAATGQSYRRVNLQSALDAIMPADEYGSTAGAAFGLGTISDHATATGIIGQLGDVDYFRFTAGASGVATFSVTTADALELELIGAGARAGDAVLTFDVVAGGQYVIGVGSGGGIGRYETHVDVVSPADDVPAASSDGTSGHDDLLASVAPASGPDQIGIWRDGRWMLDVDGDGVIDWSDPRAVFRMGQPADVPLVGDWDGDGDDEVGLRRGNQFILDVDGNGRWTVGVDRAFRWGRNSDTPLVGDWNGDGYDEVGLRRGNQFILDVDGNGRWTVGVDRAFRWGRDSDTPLVGDWNGDGYDEVGYRTGNKFVLDMDGNGRWTVGVDRAFRWGLTTDTPLVGDWNGDGYDEIGVHRGDQFILDVDGNGRWTSGVDRAFRRGLATDTPLVGDWNVAPAFGPDQIGTWRDGRWMLDVDGDGAVDWSDPRAAFRMGRPADVPLVGDWDGDGDDEVGLRRGNQFILDVDGNGRWTVGVDRAFRWGLDSDTPLVGDWNGDGYDEVGLQRGNEFILDVDGNGRWTVGVDWAFRWGLDSDTPLVGDWNGDGFDEVGYRTGNKFVLDMDGNGRWTVGVDRAFRWGLTTDTPLVGDWNGDGYDKVGLRRGNQFILDVDGNGRWTSGIDRAFRWGLDSDTPLIGHWAAAAPLTAASRPALAPAHTANLTTASLASIVDHAVAVFTAAPRTPEQQRQVDRSDVHPTPWDHMEFDIPHSASRMLHSMDRLTALKPEIGCVRGYDHVADDDRLMSELLAPGERRLPSVNQLDAPLFDLLAEEVAPLWRN